MTAAGEELLFLSLSANVDMFIMRMKKWRKERMRERREKVIRLSSRICRARIKRENILQLKKFKKPPAWKLESQLFLVR